MPELPEVETVRQTLAPALGMQVREVWSSREKLRGQPIAAEALAGLTGQTLVELGRRGKTLLLRMTRDVVIVHLGMSGRLVWARASVPRPKHTHAVLVARDGHELRFIDARRFGKFEVIAGSALATHQALGALGPDPLAEGTSGVALYAVARRRKAPIKALLLDQRVIAGVGNIYASEALWLAHLHPLRPAASLTQAQCSALAAAVVQTLRDAIAHGGTSLRDFVNGTGDKGRNAPNLNVYGRAGQPCRRCATALTTLVVAGRNTYLCPRCQPAPRRGKVAGL